MAVKVNTSPQSWHFRDQKPFVDWPFSVDAPHPAWSSIDLGDGGLSSVAAERPTPTSLSPVFFALHSRSIAGLQGTVLPNRSWGTRNSAYSCDPHSDGSPFGDLSGRDMLAIISCTPMTTLTRCLPSSLEKYTSMHSRPSVTEGPLVCVCMCVFRYG